MNKRTAVVLSLILCLVLGALRVADLCFLSDPATGFARVGESWHRYLIVAAAAVVMFMLSRGASVRPLPFKHCRPALGCAMLLTAALLFETSVSTLLTQLDGFATLRGVLLLANGLWFAGFGVQAFFAPPTKSPPAALCLGGLAAPIWVAIERFAIRPSSLARTGHVLGVLSILAALCCVDYLLKMIFLPGAPFGKAMTFTGMLAFLLCTCMELPETMISYASGGATLLDLVQSGCWASVGLCGLVGAIYASGEDRKDLPLFKIPADGQ